MKTKWSFQRTKEADNLTRHSVATALPQCRMLRGMSSSLVLFSDSKNYMAFTQRHPRSTNSWNTWGRNPRWYIHNAWRSRNFLLQPYRNGTNTILAASKEKARKNISLFIVTSLSIFIYPIPFSVLSFQKSSWPYTRKEQNNRSEASQYTFRDAAIAPKITKPSHNQCKNHSEVHFWAIDWILSNKQQSMEKSRK